MIVIIHVLLPVGYTINFYVDTICNALNRYSHAYLVVLLIRTGNFCILSYFY